MAFDIQYSPEAKEHLKEFTKREQAIILDAIERQLKHQPNEPTRNRKFMRPNPLAAWELRIDKIRVYYRVEEEPEPQVSIQAIGTKIGNRVFIANEEVEL